MGKKEREAEEERLERRPCTFETFFELHGFRDGGQKKYPKEPFAFLIGGVLATHRQTRSTAAGAYCATVVLLHSWYATSTHALT